MAESGRVYKVIGMKVHKFIGKNLEGSNLDFTYYSEEQTYYVLCLTNEKKKYELKLYKTYRECYSGWTICICVIGNSELKQVDYFDAITHVPRCSAEISFDGETELPEEYSCELFDYSVSGGVKYYPCGHVVVNMERFIPTGRGFKTHPVWIFMGSSNLGKSFIAQMAARGCDDGTFSVFETDSHKELPSEITALGETPITPDFKVSLMRI